MFTPESKIHKLGVDLVRSTLAILIMSSGLSVEKKEAEAVMLKMNPDINDITTLKIRVILLEHKLYAKAKAFRAEGKYREEVQRELERIKEYLSKHS